MYNTTKGVVVARTCRVSSGEQRNEAELQEPDTKHFYSIAGWSAQMFFLELFTKGIFGSDWPCSKRLASRLRTLSWNMEGHQNCRKKGGPGENTETGELGVMAPLQHIKLDRLWDEKSFMWGASGTRMGLLCLSPLLLN